MQYLERTLSTTTFNGVKNKTIKQIDLLSKKYADKLPEIEDQLLDFFGMDFVLGYQANEYVFLEKKLEFLKELEKQEKKIKKLKKINKD